MRSITVILILISISMVSVAQTCCSGGVPLSSNIGFQSSAAGEWQWALSYDVNRLKTLFNENEVLEPNNRERITRSYLGRLGYGISHNVSIETLLPFINQKRHIIQNNGEINSESSAGIGDIVLLLKIDAVRTVTTSLNVGGGIKFPTGSTGQTNSQGLLLVNDMQPGSGALDLLGRISMTQNMGFRPSLTLYLNAVASIKRTDSDYLGSQEYQYGNDIQIMAGFSDQITSNYGTFYPGIGLRMRNANQDKINKYHLENTGGHWVFTRASIGIDIHKQHRISMQFEFPIYTKVDGTQLSPDQIINITYSSSFFSEPNNVIKIEEILL